MQSQCSSKQCSKLISLGASCQICVSAEKIYDFERDRPSTVVGAFIEQRKDKGIYYLK